jgi:hypothetical protein
LQSRELTDVLRQCCQPILLEIQVVQRRGLAEAFRQYSEEYGLRSRELTDVLRQCCQLILLEVHVAQSRELADALRQHSGEKVCKAVS